MLEQLESALALDVWQARATAPEDKGGAGGAGDKRGGAGRSSPLAGGSGRTSPAKLTASPTAGRVGVGSPPKATTLLPPPPAAAARPVRPVTAAALASPIHKYFEA